jgi:hypothetical protein
MAPALGLRAGSDGLFILSQARVEKETRAMSFNRWLWTGRTHRPAQKTGPSLASRYRPRLETLEDRCLPSTLTVSSTADSGPGSLRDTLAAAQSGDTIVFDRSLDGKPST